MLNISQNFKVFKQFYTFFFLDVSFLFKLQQAATINIYFGENSKELMTYANMLLPKDSTQLLIK